MLKLAVVVPMDNFNLNFVCHYAEFRNDLVRLKILPEQLYSRILMLMHESDQFLNYASVQHMSVHMCKNCFEPDI